MDTHTGLIARTSEDSLRDSDDARVDDLISRQLQSEVDATSKLGDHGATADSTDQYDLPHGRNISCQTHLVDFCCRLEGRYYECSDIEEFFDYVASKLLPSRTSLGHQPINGAELRRWVTGVCQERRQALLSRKILPYRDGDRENLDRAIDCWLEIEGRRSMQEAVSALTSSYRLAFGPEESTAEFLLSTTCLSRVQKNQQHVSDKTSELGKANSIVSMRLIQRIEALEPRPNSGGSGFSRFPGQNGKQGLENFPQLTGKPKTTAVDPPTFSSAFSSAFSQKLNTTRDPDELSSQVVSPSEPGSACIPTATPSTDPSVSMPNRILRHPELATRRQQDGAEPQTSQGRGGNDLSRSKPKSLSKGTQTTPNKLTSSTQMYGRSWDAKPHAPGNAGSSSGDALGSDRDEAFSQSARGSGTRPSSSSPIRQRTTYQYDDKTSARIGGPAVKKNLFPAAQKNKQHQKNRGAASQEVLGRSSARLSTDDEIVRMRPNAAARQPPSSSSRTGDTTAHSVSPQKTSRRRDDSTIPKTSPASPQQAHLAGAGDREEYRYSSRWSPRGAHSKSSPKHQHRNATGNALKTERDADAIPTPSTPTNTTIPRGDALLTAEHSSRGRHRYQPQAQQPLMTPCSDRKRKFHQSLDDDIDVDIIDLTISSDESDRGRSRRKGPRNARSHISTSPATQSVEQRLANLEKLIGAQDER